MSPGGTASGCCMKYPRKCQALCQWPFLLQTTRDHDMAPSAAQDTRQHEQREDAASDADSEDDLLNQVISIKSASGCMVTALSAPPPTLHKDGGPSKREFLCKPIKCEKLIQLLMERSEILSRELIIADSEDLPLHRLWRPWRRRGTSRCPRTGSSRSLPSSRASAGACSPAGSPCMVPQNPR